MDFVRCSNVQIRRTRFFFIWIGDSRRVKRKTRKWVFLPVLRNFVDWRKRKRKNVRILNSRWRKKMSETRRVFFTFNKKERQIPSKLTGASTTNSLPLSRNVCQWRKAKETRKFSHCADQQSNWTVLFLVHRLSSWFAGNFSLDLHDRKIRSLIFLSKIFLENFRRQNEISKKNRHKNVFFFSSMQNRKCIDVSIWCRHDATHCSSVSPIGIERLFIIYSSVFPSCLLFLNWEIRFDVFSLRFWREKKNKRLKKRSNLFSLVYSNDTRIDSERRPHFQRSV